MSVGLKRRLASLEAAQGLGDGECPVCRYKVVIVNLATGEECVQPCERCGSCTGGGRVVIPDNGRGDLYGGQL
jgi:hypothetical protein